MSAMPVSYTHLVASRQGAKGGCCPRAVRLLGARYGHDLFRFPACSGQGYEAVAAVGQCQYAVVGGAVQSGRCLQFGGGVESVERDGVR